MTLEIVNKICGEKKKIFRHIGQEYRERESSENDASVVEQ